MCDVCKNESGGIDVGVAAVPAAPVSVMWCDKCIIANAIPDFVVLTWLFSEYYEGHTEMPENPLPYPEESIAEWVKECSVWLNGRYQKIPEAYPTLWRQEYEALLADRQV